MVPVVFPVKHIIPKAHIIAAIAVALISWTGVAQACTVPNGSAGDIIYNNSEDVMQFCDGTDWRSMGVGPKTGGGCTNPHGVEGQMMFNAGWGVMQYCNSFEWVAMGRQVFDTGYNIKTSGLTVDKYFEDDYDYYNGQYGGVAISGDIMITTDYFHDGIVLWSLVDINQPKFISSILYDATLNGVSNVDIQGDYAYLSTYDGDRLVVVDISDPDNPSITGSVQDATNLNGAYGVKVSGNYAYVVSNLSDRLTVVDVSNPASPSVAGSVTSTNIDAAVALELSGNHAFVINAGASGNRRITAIDISNPAAPTVTGSLNDSTRFREPYGIDIQGNYAYITGAYNDYLSVVDISNPASMTLAGSLTNAAFDAAVGVVVDGNYAYVSYDGGITIANISNPAAITIADTIDFDYWYFTGGGYLGYANNRVYAPTTGHMNMYTFDVSNPAALEVTGRNYLYMQPMYSTSQMRVVGNYLYVAPQFADAIFVLDISRPEYPTIISEQYICDSTTRFDTHGDYLFVSCADGLGVIDISDPLFPVDVDVFADVNTYDLYGIAVSDDGNYVYAANDDLNSLVVIDVSNPAAPSYVGSIVDSDMNFCYSVTTSGNYVFMNCAGAIVSVDVSNPASPTVVDELIHANISGTYGDSLINGNYLYATAWQNDRLNIVNISDPTDLVLTSSLYNAQLDGIGMIDYADGHIFTAAENTNRFVLINVTNPASPSIATSIQSATSLASAYVVAYGGGYVYVHGDNFTVIDMRDLSTACDNPAGLQGDMIYNSTHDVVQYCEGDQWVAAGQ